MFMLARWMLSSHPSATTGDTPVRSFLKLCVTHTEGLWALRGLV